MGGFTQVIRNRFFSKDPFFLIFYVTARCNARCNFCYYWDNIVEWRSRKHLEVDEIEKITRKIQSLQQLTISGGEPFLREELAEICSMFIKNSNAQFVTIPTNGVLTKKIKSTLEKVLPAHPDVNFRIGLSTPEIGEKLDDLYGVKNAFEQHQESYRMMTSLRKKFPNLSMDAGIVYSSYNADHILDIVNYVLENMEGCNPIISAVRGKPRLAESKDISIDDLERTYSYVKKNVPKINNRAFANTMNLMRDMVHEITVKTMQGNQMVIPCKAGEKLLVVYDNGDIYPCELLEKPMGNIRDFDYDLNRVAKTQASQEIVKEIVDTKCHCTWECANNNNIVFSNKYSLSLASKLLKRQFHELVN